MYKAITSASAANPGFLKLWRPNPVSFPIIAHHLTLLQKYKMQIKQPSSFPFSILLTDVVMSFEPITVIRDRHLRFRSPGNRTNASSIGHLAHCEKSMGSTNFQHFAWTVPTTCRGLRASALKGREGYSRGHMIPLAIKKRRPEPRKNPHRGWQVSNWE